MVACGYYSYTHYTYYTFGIPVQSKKDFDQLHLLHMEFKEHRLCHFVDIINCNSTVPAVVG